MSRFRWLGRAEGHDWRPALALSNVLWLAMSNVQCLVSYPMSGVMSGVWCPCPMSGHVRCPVSGVRSCPGSNVRHVRCPMSGRVRCPVVSGVRPGPMSGLMSAHVQCPVSGRVQCPLSDVWPCPVSDVRSCPVSNVRSCPCPMSGRVHVRLWPMSSDCHVRNVRRDQSDHQMVPPQHAQTSKCPSGMSKTMC